MSKPLGRKSGWKAGSTIWILTPGLPSATGWCFTARKTPKEAAVGDPMKGQCSWSPKGPLWFRVPLGHWSFCPESDNHPSSGKHTHMQLKQKIDSFGLNCLWSPGAPPHLPPPHFPSGSPGHLEGGIFTHWGRSAPSCRHSSDIYQQPC